ncbi:MAG: polysaccharide biosynthesis/export family protein [Kiloniellales bacterium]
MSLVWEIAIQGPVNLYLTTARALRFLSFLLGVTCLLAGYQTAAAQGEAVPQLSPQSDDYVLGPGDQIRVTVFGHEDLSGEFQVGSNGRVSLPLVGEFTASGLTLSRIEKDIVDRLEPDYLKDPRVAVEVLSYRPFYILGEVNQPGSYPYVNGMRVINAVALAGGFTYRAKESDLWITRTDGEREEAGPTTLVRPGDVIEVPERFF